MSKTRQKLSHTKSLLFLLLSLTLSQLSFAQGKVVAGKVSNDTGEPIESVTVTIKGTETATATNAAGEYTITVEGSNSVLVFTAVGFQKQESRVGNRNAINITLSGDSQSLEDIVVVGYGTRKKSDLTGSVVSLRSDDFNKGGANNSVAQLIQGRAAGVQVTQSSAAPGGGVSIRIRGSSSINAGNEPLYVVDGFPINNAAPIVAMGIGFGGNPPPANPLNSINPADIQSIEILKDASATAIYGSRGANGVVLITTKKGKDGRMNVDYTVTGSLANVQRKLDLLNTSDYVKTMNELAAARGVVQPFTPALIQSYGAGTDWQDVIFRDAYTQDHNLSFSGGNAKTTFFTSLNYNNQGGIILNTNFQRLQARLNLEHRASEKFRFGINVNAAQLKDQQVPTGSNQVNQDADVINSISVIPPIFNVYNPDGSYVRPESGQAVSVTLDNPYAIALGSSARGKNNRTFGNIFGEYTIIPGLSARVTLGSDFSNSRTDVYKSTITQRGNSYNGGASILTGELNTSLIEGLLNYQKDHGRHSVSAVAGYTYQQFDMRRFNGTIRGFPSDLTGTNALELGDTNLDDLSSLTTRRRLNSYLARVNYSFNKKYLFTASFRADGSSNFGKNNPYGYFPSFAGAWRLSEEAFIKNLELFSDLKLRAGYGQIGNDDIGIGNAYATYAGGGQVNFGPDQLNTVGPTRIPNPDLRWEATEQYNAGIDFGFFGGRLTGSADFFIKKTKDLLISLPIPMSTGFGSITTNIGSVRNRGFELFLTSVNLNGKFGWKTTFNIATLSNEVTSIGNVPSIVNTLYGTSAIARPGDPLFAYFGYQADGIFQSAEEVANSAQKGVAVPGVPKWKDVNNDGKIDAADRVVLGKSFPDFTWGLDNSFSFGPFDLSIFIDGAQGYSLFNFAMVDALYPNDPYRNRLAKPLLNRWTADNPTNEYPSGVDFTKYGGGNVNSYTVNDASFIRIKNVLLSYRLPVNGWKFINGANVFVSAQNLKTFTDYEGFDPDVNSTGSTIVRVDRNSYPSARTFSLGLNVKF
ncbi:MAG: TonB-dependent receptor [Flavitalea sp.]